jgi:hypothetical protein
MRPMGRRGVAVRSATASALILAAVLAILAPRGAADAARPGRGAAAGVTAQGQPALHVIPFPGTPDASPQSQIIFSSLRPSDIQSVIVTGSSSGTHSGHRAKLPDNGGTVFVPAKSFTPGENVSVQAFLNSSQAGTASGDPGATVLHFSFTVAVPVKLSPAGASAASTPREHRAARSRHPRFRSAPGLYPAPVHMSRRAPGNRDIFLSPEGLMILNPSGQLVWFRHIHHQVPINLAVQSYRGQRVLTWWQGHLITGHGTDGREVILNSSYRQIATVRAGWGLSSDLHEFQITPQGTALLDAFYPVRADLSSVGGPTNGVLFDNVIQQVDIRTGQVLWEWHAYGHVPLRDSYYGVSRDGEFDYFHINSIQRLPGQRLLISSRMMWAVYLINAHTGRLIWTLGGKSSSFRMGPGTGFRWQHDAHLNGHGLLTLFNDGPDQRSQSSALELKLDASRRTVSLAHRQAHSPPLLASSQGSVQLLRGGEMFVGWGSQPDFSQYTRSGRQIFNGTLPLTYHSYRAYRFPWIGHPHDRPALALSRSGNGTTWLYVSWNGATQVAQWRVLGGPSVHRLAALKTVPRHSFETAIALPGAPRHLAVQALDAHGHTLGRSQVATRPG